MMRLSRLTKKELIERVQELATRLSQLEVKLDWLELRCALAEQLLRQGQHDAALAVLSAKALQIFSHKVREQGNISVWAMVVYAGGYRFSFQIHGVWKESSWWEEPDWETLRVETNPERT